MTLKTQIQNFNEKLERLENALRLALTSPTKQFTQEAIEDILKGKGLAEKLPKKYQAEA
jgi:hypothetical protein